jgi:iron-sulfur cluster assembly accessory protein
VLQLTENAVKKVEGLYGQDKTLEGKYLRVFVETGGCSGYQYGFAFDSKKEGDAELAFGGLKVLVDPKSAPLIEGSVIDYKEDFGSEGFSISNPQAKKSCGCGHSFEA